MQILSAKVILLGAGLIAPALAAGAAASPATTPAPSSVMPPAYASCFEKAATAMSTDPYIYDRCMLLQDQYDQSVNSVAYSQFAVSGTPGIPTQNATVTVTSACASNTPAMPMFTNAGAAAAAPARGHVAAAGVVGVAAMALL